MIVWKEEEKLQIKILSLNLNQLVKMEQPSMFDIQDHMTIGVKYILICE